MIIVPVYCKEKIDQTQLQWYLGQFLRAPAGPGRAGFYAWQLRGLFIMCSWSRDYVTGVPTANSGRPT